jgi:hypothetical protein
MIGSIKKKKKKSVRMERDLMYLRAMLPLKPPDVPVTFRSLRTPRDIDGLLPPLTDLDPWSSGWWWEKE